MKTYVMILLIGLCMASCTKSQADEGLLQGHVTIGPLVPVLREGEEAPTPAPEVYAARQIVIFTSDMRAEISRIAIDAQGNYSLLLPEGEYTVDINRLGMDSADGFPRKIEIIANQVLTLDVDIDTGIR